MNRYPLYPTAEMLGAGYVMARHHILAKSGLDPGIVCVLPDRLTPLKGVPDRMIQNYAAMAAEMYLYMLNTPISTVITREDGQALVYYVFRPALLENRLVGKTATAYCFCRLAMDYPDQVRAGNEAIFSFDGGLALMVEPDHLSQAHVEAEHTARNACLVRWMSVRFDPEGRERFEASLGIGSVVTARSKFGGVDTLAPAITTKMRAKSVHVELTQNGKHFHAGQELTLPLATSTAWTLRNSIWPTFPFEQTR